MNNLTTDRRIAELYDLWYEQRARVIKTYSQRLPERVPLSQNEEFKAVRNAVVKAAVDVLKVEQAPSEGLARQNQYGYSALPQSLTLLQ